MSSRLLVAPLAATALLALLFFVPARNSRETPSWVRVRLGNTASPGEKKGPSGAMQALEYWSAQRAYPNRSIPRDRYGAALEKVRTMRTQLSSGLEDQVQPWEPLGPANVGGRTLCLALHPTDPDVIFAGSASGGLWKSTTGGVGADAWDYVEVGFPVLGVSTIAIDSANPDVMYIGTGEAYAYEGSIGGEVIRTTRGSYGVGILKTEDGGLTWAPSLDWTYDQSRGVWMIQIHPTNSDMLYAATTEGIYKSIDAGLSWNLVHVVIMGMDVRIHPTSPNIVFAAHGNFGSTGHGIYRSVDDGQNWSKLSVGLPASWSGKTQLAIAPTAPGTIFASIADVTFGRGLYKSTDTGNSWVQINATNYQAYQGWYSHYVLASPFDAQTLFVGGIEIWRSTNGGSSLSARSNWQEVFFGVSPPEGPLGGPHYAHADHHFAVWHPTDPNTIFFASDGGVFKTTDLGDTFQSLIGGYQTSQFYNGFSNSGSDPDFAMGGLQDNFTVIYQGTNAWRRVIGGDGSWTAVNPLLSTTIYGSYQYLNILRSYDSGDNWSNVTPPDMPGDSTAFVGPYALCAGAPSVLYAGRTRVYRSNSEGSSWTATNHGTPLSSGNPVISLAVAQTDPNTAYAGTAPIVSAARVFVTRNGGNTWVPSSGLPDRYPSDFAIDPNDPLTGYVSFMGFGTPHLYKTTNGGAVWTDIGSGLPDVPTSAVEVDPDHPDVIYVGTDLGIFFSDDAGLSWQPFTSGMPLAMVNDLKVFLPERKIRAATHGNGAYERDLFDPNACADLDFDGTCDGSDCAPGNPEAWQLPGEVTGLVLSHSGGPAGTTILSWVAPAEPGGTTVLYDTVSSLAPDDFDRDPSVSCVELNDGLDTQAADTAVPGSGQVIYYLIRGENDCGHGSVGTGSSLIPRFVTDCP